MEKIAVLYGYIPSRDYSQRDVDERTERSGVSGGEDAASMVVEAVRSVAWKGATSPPPSSVSSKDTKINRSYGHKSKGTDIVAQDAHTGAITEVLTCRAPPLLLSNIEKDADKSQRDELRAKNKKVEQTWVNEVNAQLQLDTTGEGGRGAVKM
eukprot:13923319-Ditylum_brightwellii.AAC.1